MQENTPYVIYSESTPNPHVMKFVANKLLAKHSKEVLDISQTGRSTLLRQLFSFPFVEEIFISSNYISIKKNNNIEWMDVTNQIRIFIQDELNKNTKIYEPVPRNLKVKNKGKEMTKFLLQVEKVIDNTIRPSIQMDGGDIEIVSCEDGVLQIFLKGACSGCPSSQMTLKNGIEVLLKNEFPEKINTVVAINN